MVRRKLHPPLVFHWLSKESFGDIKKVINATKTQIFEKYIFGQPLPKNYKEIASENYFPYSFQLSNLLKWMAISFEYYKDQINLFIDLKSEYEKYFLLGQYRQAEAVIEKIEDDICVSLWSIENRLLIAEYDQGLEKNKALLTSINSSENNYLVNVISDFYSRRTEKNISVQKYNDTLNKFLIKNARNNQGVIEYFNFKLNFPNYSNYQYFEMLLYPELRFSIIDRYLSFIQVCKYILSKKNESEETTSTIINLTKRLSILIKDESLQSINTLFSPLSKIEIDEKSILALKIFDEYTAGNYRESQAMSKELITSNPNCLEFYEIYVKSLIRLNSKYEVLVSERSIANEICLNIFNVLSKGDKTHDAIFNLRKIVTSLGNFDFNNQLYSFIQETIELSKNQNNKIFRELNSKIYNPRLANALEDPKISLQYIMELKKIFKFSSSTLNFYDNFYNAIISSQYSMPHNSVYSKQRIDHYNAKLFKIHQKYDKAIKLYENIITDSSSKVPGYLQEEIVLDLFECYLSDNFINKGLRLFTHNYFKNELLILKLDVYKLIKLIESDSSKSYLKDIEVTILYHFFYSKTNEIGKIYGAYANFMASKGLKKPSELRKNLNDYDFESILYFFKNICVPEIIDSSIYFDDIEEIENERVNICQILSEIDPEKKDSYLAEISSISKKATLRKRLREVDESKIHVDVEGIIKLAGSQISESFLRYKEISSFTDDGKFQVFDILESIMGEDLHFYFIEADSKGVIKATKSQEFMAYKELFIEIRDHFISSNEYGLDSYLSIKIRHGTFLNHIRSVFKTENLITEKNKDTSNYLENQYWLEKLIYLEEGVKVHLSDLFNRFSKGVDDIITLASSKWLQVNTEDKVTDGMFNYVYTDAEIFKSMNRNKNIEDHIEMIYSICEELWNRTEVNLTNVRNVLSKDLKLMLLKELTKLESQLKLILEDSGSAIDLLFRSITKCGTDLQNQIEKISKWFTITENKRVIDFSVQELFETCLTINHIIYPYNGIEVNPTINSSSLLKGSTFTHFVDIFSTLFENVVKYAEGRKVDLIVNEDKGILEIAFSNVISATLLQDYEKYCINLEAIINSIKNKISPDQIRKEGGSGFYKIVKILKYDLSVQNSDLVIKHDKKENILIVTIKLDLERIHV